MSAPRAFSRFVAPSRRDRRRLLAAAVGVFALTALLRFVVGNSNIPLSTLWFIPVALATLAVGFRGALVASLAAVAAQAVWLAVDWPAPLDTWEIALRSSVLVVPWLIFGWVLEMLRVVFRERERAAGELQQVHRDLERRAGDLERANAELERSNRDLEQFANVASHDLREPLRVVEGLVDLLERRASDRLEAEHRRYLEMMRAATGRMQELIDDILAWSRAGSATLEVTEVDMAALVEEVEDALGAAIAEAGASVEAGELPVVWGDASQLRQVFQNLLSNAIKFRGEAAPRVEVRAAPEGDGWRFTVADNGIGIPPEHARRVFEMFNRLHGREAYAGTGIGLSICAMVVERHGGRIWVEPRDGGGSVFAFTLPQRVGAGPAVRRPADAAGQRA